MTRTALKLPLVAVRLALVGLVLHSSGAMAISLTQAYDAALQNDPVFRAAIAESDAGKEYGVIGRSTLLPVLQGSFYKNKNHADLIQPDFTGKRVETHPQYSSGSSSISLRQPLFNLEALARYKQGLAQTSASDAQFAAREQELVLRVVGAYTEALFANEQVRLATAQRDTYGEQMKVNNRMFEKGEGTKTDMLETQARLDVAEASLLEVQDNATTARATLAGIVGQDVGVLDELAPTFHIMPPIAASFEELKQTALKNNPEVQYRVFSIETARQEINKARSGHAPRLDFTASYSKNDAETLNTFNQESTARAIGIQLTVPLYQGGYVSAISRQAVAGHERAKADLQAQTDKILVELRKQYSLVTSSMARIQALDKAVSSGKLLMQATEQSIKGGVRINLDLLNAQQQLFASERDLAQARYNYLLSTLRLRAAAGTLNSEHVREMAVYFR